MFTLRDSQFYPLRTIITTLPWPMDNPCRIPGLLNIPPACRSRVLQIAHTAPPFTDLNMANILIIISLETGLASILVIHPRGLVQPLIYPFLEAEMGRHLLPTGSQLGGEAHLESCSTELGHRKHRLGVRVRG